MAKKKTSKWYVVWRGRKTGVFKTWSECKSSVDGFRDAKYKSFASKQLADIAFERSTEEPQSFAIDDLFFAIEVANETLAEVAEQCQASGLRETEKSTNHVIKRLKTVMEETKRNLRGTK